MPPKIDLIFEVSWEVCNKVGGIYTVLSSKSYLLHKAFGDKIIFIGPDFDNSDCKLFIEDPTVFPDIFDIVPPSVKIRTGRWNVPGEPIALLVDFSRKFDQLNDYYGAMWGAYGVDSLHSYGDYGEACAFSIAAAQVIRAFYNHDKKKYKKVIAHFNEWTTGMGLLYLKTNCPSIATVFTTHATSIGRSICGNNKPLYAYLKGYNGDQMAEELNMQSKHSLEKSAAHNADCFTAVSDITAREAEQLLGIYPQVVTPNGFEKAIAGTAEDQKKWRRSSRKQIFKVLEALTGKKYSDSTLLIATSGRNEYKNKGIDIFLDTIANLRGRKLKRKVVALVLVPAWVKEARTDLQAKLSGDSRVGLGERNLTHWLNNPESDAIYSRIKQLNFTNIDTDNVDIVYMPCYLDGADGILNLNYYEALPGIDITIFPSYYEPWGYTPLESVAFGVPTITTSLSGFGQWVKSTFGDKSLVDTGVEVVERDDFNYHHVIEDIVNTITVFTSLNKEDVQKVKDNARKTAALAEWENFIKYYFKAYAVALDNAGQRNQKK